jgi:AraC-like DNA-binding protein
LVDSGGAVPIRRIAGEVGWSHKIARFKQQVGLPPKTAARLVRFERAQRRLDRRGQTSWADIAAESGYADQAHLVREFRDFTGTTPTGFVTHGRAA